MKAGPSGGEPRYLGILGASRMYLPWRAVVEILNVTPNLVPTIAAQARLGLCPELAGMHPHTTSPTSDQRLETTRHAHAN